MTNFFCMACEPGKLPPWAGADAPTQPGHHAARWRHLPGVDVYIDGYKHTAVVECLEGNPGLAIVLPVPAPSCTVHKGTPLCAVVKGNIVATRIIFPPGRVVLDA